MNIHAISTGCVKITRNWQVGHGPGPVRLLFTLLDTRFTNWLPIHVWVVEHPEGLIVIDTGIPANANAPISDPPFMRLVQRAALRHPGPRLGAGGRVSPPVRAPTRSARVGACLK